MKTENSNQRREGKFVSTPEQEAIVVAIAAALERLEPGDVLPYSNIDNLMKGNRNLLYRARDRVIKKTGAIFGTIYKVGIKRLERENIDTVSVKKRASIVRGVVRVKGNLIVALQLDGTNISRQDKLKINSELAKLGLIEVTSKE
jgi:hypothetical protein